MAKDITMDILLNPKVDTQAFNREVNKLQTGLNKVKYGRHSQQEFLAARLIASMVQSGVASSETQARMILTGRMGGRFNSQAMSILRTGENIARVSRTQGLLEQTGGLRSFSEAQLMRMRTGGADVYRRFRNIESSFASFKDKPGSVGALEIGGDIKSLRVDLAKLYNEYRAQGRKIPDYLRQISKNTSAMKKEVSGTSEEHSEGKSVGGGFWGGAGKFLGKLIGIGSLLALFRKGIEGFQKSLERGNIWFHAKAAYGSAVNAGDIAERAAIFQMSREAAMSTNTYAADFRQRMLWGEISEREIIGLSRAGKWGRMVMSGEAARNPAAANAAFEAMVASTDPAKMRSILSQLGLSQELMNYRIQGYTPEQRKEYSEKFHELAELELEGAQTLYDASIQYKLATEQLSADILAFASVFTEAGSPQARDVYRRLRANPSLRDTTAFKSTADVKNANILTQNALQPISWSLNGTPTRPVAIGTLTNNITIQGNADENTIEKMKDTVSEETSISNWLLGTTNR